MESVVDENAFYVYEETPMHTVCILNQVKLRWRNFNFVHQPRTVFKCILTKSNGHVKHIRRYRQFSWKAGFSVKLHFWIVWESYCKITHCYLPTAIDEQIASLIATITILTTNPLENSLSKTVDYPTHFPSSNLFLNFTLPGNLKMAPEKTKSNMKATEAVTAVPITSL